MFAMERGRAAGAGEMSACLHGVVIPEGGWELPEGVDDRYGEFYMACDCCDYPMSHDCSSIYYDQKSGETLCTFCAPDEGGKEKA
jgi:hypothetical protein